MAGTVAKLNELLAIHYRSFPMYLSDAGVWRDDSTFDDELARAVRTLVADYRVTCGKLATAILDRNGSIDPSWYPMEFTDTNFLSLEYLLGEIIERHRADLASMQRIVVALGAEPDAKTLAQEAVGAAKAHLETLEGLAAKQHA
ncbi:MAG: hypothetical protein JNL96_17035 [Planctomycetaceae bacterium]|nr:hypothetical protein [Planctomycetaceae bacterium]